MHPIHLTTNKHNKEDLHNLYTIIKAEENFQTFSLSVSSADVASSNKSILGLRIKARAMEILCFCPPDINVPLSPTNVSYPYKDN